VALVAFIGFGELGAALAQRLGDSGAHEMRAWTRAQPDLGATALAARTERMRAAGVEPIAALEDALRGAGTVLSVVSGASSREVAERCAELLDAGALYVDLTAAAVAEKETSAEAVERAGGRYVDGAVLGTVAVPDATIPIVASGDGARELQQLASGGGISIEALDGPAGRATQLKLLRSVYMKGRDALVVETLLAARRCGLEERLVASIEGPGERVSFADLSDRVLRSLAIHAGRRAEELDSSADVVRETGIEPLLAPAAAATLRRVAEAGVREAFGGERPESGAEVLALLDERLSEAAAPESG
jgi:3-hydroxyisobutyrate dehydrogenase-like beta-hydroxyacid dehydrogenase